MKFGMKKTAAAAVLAAVLVSLSACAHKDLTAPCSRDASLWRFGSAYAAGSPTDCGPLLPVNP